MPIELKSYGLTHAHLKPAWHARLKAEINGRSAVRILRFLQPVEITRLEIPKHVYGRGAPKVPVHPAHLLISILDRKTNAWRLVREVNLKPDPRIWGKGLTQNMSEEAMNAHFARILKEDKPWVVELPKLKTDHLRVECDREHPVWPSHNEYYGSIYSIPFKILDPLKVFGRVLPGKIAEPQYLPCVKATGISPKAPRGMRVRQRGETVLFEGRKLSVGFALKRPIIMHLGWDALGEGLAGHNRVAIRRVKFSEQNRGIGGPLLVTLNGDFGSHHWTGEVSVRGNTVSYKNLRVIPGVRLDAVFHVEPGRLVLELIQRATRDVPVLEVEAWRFCFALGRGMTGVAGLPTLRAGRSGEVALPALFAGDGNGALACRLLDGDPELARLQVESYRPSIEVTAGIMLGRRAEGTACQIVRRGKISATIELAVTRLMPDAPRRAQRPGKGIARHWTSNFSCFRPELAGFSNNAVSTFCCGNQVGPIEVAAFTRKPKAGPDPRDLIRFTIGRALLDGGAYGYWRNLYMDSDPILISAAGRVHQVDPDMAWLQSVGPGILEGVKRMLAVIGKEGLAVCRDLSGNSGSWRWSANHMDCVGFGHLDAYVNAWTFRGLRNAAALLSDLGERGLSGECRTAAVNLKANYARHLINPKTGWVAGWKSRDGKLHDPAYLWINGPACAFGVLEPKVARRALANLEKLRDKLGLGAGRLSVPFNLLPTAGADHMLPRLMPGAGATEPSFEFFTDGGMAPCAATYYLRALSIHGFKKRAKDLAKALDEGFAQGLFSGGTSGDSAFGDGQEFLSWEGLGTGYEGSFGPNFGALYGVAVEQSLIVPPEPEWWPPGG